MAAALGVSKSQIARDAQAGMPMDDPAAARAWREQQHDMSRTVEGRIDRTAPTQQSQQPQQPQKPDAVDDQAADDTDTTDDPAAPADADTAAYRTARADRERTNADRARIELDQLRGRLIDVDEARRLAFTAFRSLRDAVLNVPARVAAQAAAESDVLRVEHLIEGEIAAALARFEPTQLLTDTEETDDEPG